MGERQEGALPLVCKTRKGDHYMKRTGHLIFAALFTIGLAGLSYAAGTGGSAGGGASGFGGGASGSAGVGSSPGIGPGMDAPPPPGTTPGTPPGSDIGRTPKPGTDKDIAAPPGAEVSPGSTRRPGESSLELGRQPVPPGSSLPPDSGLTPPAPTGEGQGTGSGLGSPTPGLGSSAPSNPAGSQGASPGTGATK